MVVKECKSCKTEINDKASKCPNCKADQRNFFMKHKILSVILGLVLLGIIVGAAGGGSGTEGEDNNSNNVETTQTQTAEVPEQINANQLADDFDANQVAAEEKWKNKLVQFTANVSNITDSGISFYNVGSKEFSMTQISCAVSNRDELMSIQNGQDVTVKGRVGSQSFGVIDIKECSLVR